MSDKIIEFPVPSGELVWITGSFCEECGCEDCRARNGKVFKREILQQLKFKFRPPIHDDCDCQLVERIIGEEKGDYNHYKPGIRRLHPLRLDE